MITRFADGSDRLPPLPLMAGLLGAALLLPMLLRRAVFFSFCRAATFASNASLSAFWTCILEFENHEKCIKPLF